MDINTVLQKWNNAKKQKALYEKECDTYKNAVEIYMTKKNKDSIQGTDFTISKRSNTRQTMSKDNTPIDIWNKYSTRFSYNSYYLKKN